MTKAQEDQNNNNFEDCVDAANKILKNEPEVEAIRFHGYDRLCHCQVKVRSQL